MTYNILKLITDFVKSTCVLILKNVHQLISKENYTRLEEQYGSEVLSHIVSMNHKELLHNKCYDSNFYYDLMLIMLQDHQSILDKVQEINNIKCTVSDSIFKNASVNVTNIGSLKNNFLKLLQKIGRAFNINDEELRTMKRQINKRCNDIVNNSLTITGDEDFLIDCCSDEIKYRWNKTHDMSKLSTTSVVRISKVDDNSSSEKIQVSSLLDTFNNDKVECVIIEGSTGTGKSTLLHNITSFWAQHDYSVFNKLNNYKVVFYIDCQHQSCDSLQVLLRSNARQLLNICNLNYDMFFRHLEQKNVLFLVDNFDVVNNNNSMSLLKEILRKYASSNFVFSVNPVVKKDLIQFLNGLNYVNYKLEGLDNEGLKSFINNCLVDVTLDSNEKVEIVENIIKTITELTSEMKQLLYIPLNLSLCLELFKTLHKDQYYSLLNSDILDHITSKLAVYIAEKAVNYPVMQSAYQNLSVILDFLKELEDIAYDSVLNDKDNISLEYYKHLTSVLKQGNISNCDAVISCFLNYNMTDQASLYPTFSFHSKIVQEYMAAKNLIRKIIINKNIDVPTDNVSNLKNTCLMLLQIITKEDNHGSNVTEINTEVMKLITSACIREDACDLSIGDVSDVVHSSRYNTEVVKHIAPLLRTDVWNIHDCDDIKIRTCTMCVDIVQPRGICVYDYYTSINNYEYFKKFLDLIKTRKQVSLKRFKGSLPAHLIQQLPTTLDGIDLKLSEKEELNSLSDWVNNNDYKGRLLIEVPYNLITTAALRGKVTQVTITHNSGKTGEEEVQVLVSCLINLFITNKQYRYLWTNFIKSSSLTRDDYIKLLSSLKQQRLWIPLLVESPHITCRCRVEDWSPDDPFKSYPPFW